jgi:hypothetical protein
MIDSHVVRPRLATAVNAVTLEDELDTLADTLRFLVARDDERPPKWYLPAFDQAVALTRTRVAAVTSGRRLASHLELDQPSTSAWPFERAARRLASDPIAVALAIRLIEIEADIRLPGWLTILHRRMLHPISTDRASGRSSASTVGLSER